MSSALMREVEAIPPLSIPLLGHRPRCWYWVYWCDGARTLLATTRSVDKSDLLHERGAEVVIDTGNREVLQAIDGDGAGIAL